MPPEPPKVRTYKRGKWRAPHYRLVRGPADEAVTGGGTYPELYGYRWAFLLDKKEGARVFREEGGAWIEHEPKVPLPDVPKRARQLVGVFDQAARPVLAWEHAGELRITQYDAREERYVVRGPFVGRDPVLLAESGVNATVGGSEVLLFHLSLDRRTVYQRPQSSLYADASEVTVLPEPHYLDQAAVSWLRYALFLGTDRGETRVLQSDLYPIHSEGPGPKGSAAPLAGQRRVVVMRHSAGETLGGGVEPVAGERRVVVMRRSAGETLGGGVEPVAGERRVVVMRHSAGETLGGGVEPVAGERVRVVARYEHENVPSLTGGAHPVGGERRTA